MRIVRGRVGGQAGGCIVGGEAGAPGPSRPPPARRISCRSRRAVRKSRSARATSARTMREPVERWSAQARSAQARACGPRPRSSAASARRRSRSAARSTASTRPRSVRQRWQTGAVPRRLAPHVGQRATPVVPPVSPVSRRGPDFLRGSADSDPRSKSGAGGSGRAGRSTAALDAGRSPAPPGNRPAPFPRRMPCRLAAPPRYSR